MRVPQSGQNAQRMSRPLSEERVKSRSSPESSVKSSLRTTRLIPKALPDCRWHSRQWHTASASGEPPSR